MIGWSINIALFICILFVGTNKEYVATKRGRSVFILLAALQLLSIQWLKDITLLPDEATYKYYYEHFSWDLYESFEPGFRFFVSKLRIVSQNFHFFIYIYGLVLVLTHVWLMNKYSTNLILTYILFILTSFYALFIIRQYLAITLCMLSIPFVVKRRFLPFLVLTLLAMSFHGSAIVWIVVYFLYKINLANPIKVAAVFLLGGALVLYELDNLFSYALMGFDKLQYYMTDVEEQYTWKTLAVSVSTVFFASICYGKRIKELSEVRKLFYLMLWIAVLIDLINYIGTSFSAFYRVAPYFNFPMAFVLSDAVLYLKKDLRQIVVPIILVFFTWYLIAGINQQHGFGFII